MARPGFRNHPKFRRLVKLLGLPGPHVLGLCEYMWSVAYENGIAMIGDTTDVELAAGWDGEDGALCRALLDCGGAGRPGLIEEVSGSPDKYQVHDLADHAPDYVQARAIKEAERSRDKACAQCGRVYHSPDHRSLYCGDACKQASYRDRNRPALPTVTDASVTDTDRYVTATDCYRPPAPAPAPAPALKDEECSEPGVPNSPPATSKSTKRDSDRKRAAAVPVDPATCRFPVFPTIAGLKNKAVTWAIPAELTADLSAAFPAVDVPQRLRAAHLWVMANLPKRKTADGMPNFLRGWMERDQNRGGQVGTNGTRRTISLPPASQRPNLTINGEV